MSISSQNLESFVPVYDVVPDSWEEARPFLVEHLKKISNAVNIRTIGWYLDEELLSGNAYTPGVTLPGNNPSIFRQILRKVVDVSPLVAGANVFPHGVVFDANLTSINSWVEATNSSTFQAITLTYPELSLDAINININSPGAFDRAILVWEYTQEL
jgi:hypothetical protein